MPGGVAGVRLTAAPYADQVWRLAVSARIRSRNISNVDLQSYAHAFQRYFEALTAQHSTTMDFPCGLTLWRVAIQAG